MRLNGWQRLWLVAVVIAGFATLFAALHFWVDRDEMTAFHTAQMEAMSDKNVGSIHSLMGAAPMSEDARKQKLKELAAKRYDEQMRFQLEMDAYSSTKIIYIVTHIVIWIAFSGMLYLVGLLFAWVARGFKSDGSKA